LIFHDLGMSEETLVQIEIKQKVVEPVLTVLTERENICSDTEQTLSLN